MPVSPALLKIHKGSEPVWEYSVNTEVVTIGRATNSDLVINDPLVSRQHAQISRNGDRYQITDFGSTDGTRVNKIRLQPNIPHFLANGDTISIGHSELQFILDSNSVPTTVSPHQKLSSDGATVVAQNFVGEETLFLSQLDLRGRDILTIGREPKNNTVVNHPAVSRFHAKITRENGSFILKDLDSTNGTYVNGKQISERTLRVGDSVRIGPCRFVLNVDETMVRYNEEGNLRIDVVHLSKVVNKGTPDEKTLLNDISLCVEAREFVVIAGVSGGGKSTLMDALNGFRPATSGGVLVNGADLYKNFNAYRNELGYVPQKDIIHLELTIYQALDCAAKLRMPADTTATERQQRINEVLKDLGLTQRRDVQISALSGGQLKRVSMGVELLAKPSLFFLDEATSGLDPGTEADVMKLLRKLADQGRTVLLITHATENVTLCDLVVFLAAGGRVAYFGPPAEAPAYFGVEKFSEIYPLVEGKAPDPRVARVVPPEEWQKRYLQSPQYQKYVAERQKNLSAEAQGSGQGYSGSGKLPSVKSKPISALRQFLILSSRNWTCLFRDRITLALTFAATPLIASLDFILWERQMFDVQEGNAGRAIGMLFNTPLLAILIGSLLTMREIVKEVDIYRREHLIGLQVLPYILSKVGMIVILALYQAAVILLSKKMAIDFPDGLDWGAMYVTLVLATIAGMMMGLVVSAISPNQNVAPMLTILFLVPQITFGGGTVPVPALSPIGQVVSNFTLTKWSFESLVTLVKVGNNIAEDPCWRDKSKSERDKLTDKQKEEQCKCLGPKLFDGCLVPGIKDKERPFTNKAEPAKPADPGKFPDDLSQLDNYKKKVDNYKADMNRWQDEYSAWKGDRESAIGKAEGIIDNIHKDFGKTFDVNVYRNWGILGFQIAVMLGMVLVAQKLKDK
jgi:ABC-type multidrug transport system ATPase subunit/pSer/pThr/pTyr-binding forkhead associated (FHA) protein